jgi:hypothetical protein
MTAGAWKHVVPARSTAGLILSLLSSLGFLAQDKDKTNGWIL